MKCFPGTDGEQSRRTIPERYAEPGGGFVHSLDAQPECFVMNGDNIQSPGLARHVDGLFGTAMGVDPWIICADRHQHEIDWTKGIVEPGKGIRVRGVTRKTDRVSIAFQEIAVIAAMLVAHHAGTPMRNFHRGYDDWPAWSRDGFALAPVELVDIPETVAM